MSNLKEQIIELLLEIVKREENIEHLRQLASSRASDEAWLRKQILLAFRNAGFEDVQEEKYYPSRSWQKSDIFWKTESLEFWMEIKTLPTNYCGGGGKNITQSVDEVCEDIRKLGEIKTSQRKLMLLAAFYPFCGGEREDEKWDWHLKKIMDTCEEILPQHEQMEEKIPLDENAEAKVYFIWC